MGDFLHAYAREYERRCKGKFQPLTGILMRRKSCDVLISTEFTVGLTKAQENEVDVLPMSLDD
jgi:hypothetical protein